MIFDDFGVSLGVHFEVQGVTFMPKFAAFFGSRPGGGPGTYFASKTLCFARVIFRNSHSVREWSESDPNKSRKRPPK